MLGQVTKVVFKKSKPKKSYGFITAYDGEEYWFSLRGLENVELGMEVSFKGGENEKGFVATSVHPIA